MIFSGGSCGWERPTCIAAWWYWVHRSRPIAPGSGKAMATRQLWKVSYHFHNIYWKFLWCDCSFCRNVSEILITCVGWKLYYVHVIVVCVHVWGGCYRYDHNTIIVVQIFMAAINLIRSCTNSCFWVFALFFFLRLWHTQAWLSCTERDGHYGHIRRLIMVLPEIHQSKKHREVGVV